MELNQYLIIGGVIIILILAILYIPFSLWMAATVSGVKISIFELIFMKIRKSPVQEIVNGLILSEKAGLNLTKVELEAFSLTGGNIENVVHGMIAAKNAGLNLSFKNATKADSQGIEILKAVREKLEDKQESQVDFE